MAFSFAFTLLLICGQSVFGTSPPQQRLRLIGYGPREGRVEFFKDGVWGSMCDRTFSVDGWPSVVCLDLGHGPAKIARYAQGFERGDQAITFESPNCNPDNADSFLECGQDKNPSCDHTQDVYVECDEYVPTPEMKVRLVGGPNAMEGRAEYYKNGRWGTVCDRTFVVRGWPSVVCQQLGYGDAVAARYVEENERGEGHITFESPSCNPDIAGSMSECGQDSNPSCDHAKAVYVTCPAPERKDTCIVNGGECLDTCGKYRTGAKRSGNPDFRCADRSKKCCVPKETTCMFHGGTCLSGRKCSNGLKSARRLGKVGTFRCPPDSEGNRQKCCFSRSSAREDECSVFAGQCMTKDGGRCPSGFQSEPRGMCSEKGKKCCIAKN